MLKNVVSELVLTAYPFIIIGAICAAIVAIIGAIKVKGQNFILRWLLIGIIINMIALAGENTLFFLGRATFFSYSMAQAIHDPLLVFFKSLYVIGTWCHFWGAMGALANLESSFVQMMIFTGFIFYLFVTIIVYLL